MYLCEHLIYLNSEFSCGREDEDSSDGRVIGFVHQSFQGGDHEGPGLACELEGFHVFNIFEGN